MQSLEIKNFLKENDVQNIENNNANLGRQENIQIENNNINENAKLSRTGSSLIQNKNAKLRSIKKDLDENLFNTNLFVCENKENDNNRTLIVGPSFCGKTHLLINLLKLKHLTDPDRRIIIITRSPDKYTVNNCEAPVNFMDILLLIIIL